MKHVKNMNRDEVIKILEKNNIDYQDVKDSIYDLKILLAKKIRDGEVEICVDLAELNGDEFYLTLKSILNKMSKEQLISEILGNGQIYEILDEKFNNEIIDVWTEKKRNEAAEMYEWLDDIIDTQRVNVNIMRKICNPLEPAELQEMKERGDFYVD